MVNVTNEGGIWVGITRHWKCIKVTLKCLAKDQLRNYTFTVKISFILAPSDLTMNVSNKNWWIGVFFDGISKISSQLKRF